MGLGIFGVSATDVGGSTAVGVSTGTEGSTDEGVSTNVGISTNVGGSTDVGSSTGTGGSTDEGDEVCVSGVLKTGLSAIRLSLVAAGGDWGLSDFFVFFAAITESVCFIL
jgi:hypothetical protein